jgi:hypothetical protein
MLPDTVTSALNRALSRSALDVPACYSAPGVHLAKVDIGAFGESACFQDETGAVTMVTGEPLLDPGDGSAWRSRAVDTRLLHDALRRGDRDVLTRTRGQFTLVHYTPAGHRLLLATDQLGVRPLYYAAAGDRIVFASAIRILENIPGLVLDLDARGATELVLLTAALGGRSRYRSVTLLRPAELVSFTPEGKASAITRRWDRIAPTFTSESDAIAALHASFTAAVTRRRQADRATQSFLSGGLDSRAIVAALRDAGLQVRTLNFSLAGSLDDAIGARFAEAAGTLHESHPYHAGLDDAYPDMAVRVLSARPVHGTRPERPALIWAGFGGSALVGQANIWPEYIALGRQGKTAEAVDAFIARKGTAVPRRLFRPPFRQLLESATHDGVMTELARLDPPDPGRLMEFYLLLNPTRSQLHGYLEDVDQYRLEHQLPFLDTDVVATALAIPLDWLQRHHLYHKWLNCFSDAVTSVTWQTYPGHLPCPLPPPVHARPQWELSAARGFRGAALRRAAIGVLRGPLPSGFLDRRYLTLVAVAQLAGGGRHGYAIAMARDLARWWERAGRRPVPIPADVDAPA